MLDSLDQTGKLADYLQRKLYSTNPDREVFVLPEEPHFNGVESYDIKGSKIIGMKRYDTVFLYTKPGTSSNVFDIDSNYVGEATALILKNLWGEAKFIAVRPQGSESTFLKVMKHYLVPLRESRSIPGSIDYELNCRTGDLDSRYPVAWFKPTKPSSSTCKICDWPPPPE